MRRQRGRLRWSSATLARSSAPSSRSEWISSAANGRASCAVTLAKATSPLRARRAGGTSLASDEAGSGGRWIRRSARCE